MDINNNNNKSKPVLSLNYLRRISDNYNLTISQAEELFPDYKIIDNSIIK